MKLIYLHYCITIRYLCLDMRIHIPLQAIPVVRLLEASGKQKNIYCDLK